MNIPTQAALYLYSVVIIVWVNVRVVLTVGVSVRFLTY